MKSWQIAFLHVIDAGNSTPLPEDNTYRTFPIYQTFCAGIRLYFSSFSLFLQAITALLLIVN